MKWIQAFLLTVSVFFVSSAQDLNEARLWDILHSTENFEENLIVIGNDREKLPSLLQELKDQYGDSLLYLVDRMSEEANSRNFEIGILLLDETITLFQGSTSSEFLFIQASKAWLLMNMGRFEESLELNLSVLETAERKNDIEVVNHMKLQLASFYEQVEEYDLAISLFEEVEKQVSASGDSMLLMNVYLNSTSVYSSIEAYDKAIENGEKCLAIARRMGIEDFEASALGNIAWNFFNKGDFQKAIEYQSKGLVIEQELNLKLHMIDSYGTLAITYSMLGNKEKALELSEKCIALSKSQKSYPKLLDTYYYGSEMFAHLEDFETAHEFAWLYHNLYDSLLGIEKNGQIAELREKYESEKKENENQYLKAQNEQQRLLTWAIGVVAIILIIFGLLLYRSNQKTKKLYAQISAQAFELNRANNTKDRLFSIIGHDLRGPITSFETANGIIKNYLDKRNISKVDEMISHVDKSVKSLKLLLDNLLNWSLSQQDEISINLERIELKPILEEVFSVLEDSATLKSVTLRHAITYEYIFADRDTVTTVFRNLVSNAIKFSPEASDILIEQKIKEDFVEITVRDQGIGMSKDQIKKAFNIDKSKVRRGTADEKGSGLGLVLVKEFVEMNNGTIRIESEPNKGSSFAVSLPLAS